MRFALVVSRRMRSWTVCCMYCECKCEREGVCAGASASEQMKKEQVKPTQARHLPQLK